MRRMVYIWWPAWAIILGVFTLFAVLLWMALRNEQRFATICRDKGGAVVKMRGNELCVSGDGRILTDWDREFRR